MHYFENPRHTQSVIAYNFDRVYLEIPGKNCIVGMLLTCPIHCWCIIVCCAKLTVYGKATMGIVEQTSQDAEILIGSIVLLLAPLVM